MTTAVKPHLSPTQLDMLAKCGEQYRRRYMEQERRPPGIAMVRGTGVHRGLELNFRQKIESRIDLPVSDVVEAAVAGFEAELAGGYELNVDEESRGAKVVIGEAKDVVVTLAELAAADMCPDYQPVLVEQPVRIELPNNTHDLYGVIDLADDRGRVVDTKTAAKSKKQDDADSSVQLTTYTALHKVATGEFPTELRMEVLVSTKTPKRQTLVTTRSEADLAALAARIDAASRIIQAGVFMPATPVAWWCGPKWCGYWASCPFVNRGRAPQGD